MNILTYATEQYLSVLLIHDIIVERRLKIFLNSDFKNPTVVESFVRALQLQNLSYRLEMRIDKIEDCEYSWWYCKDGLAFLVNAGWVFTPTNIIDMTIHRKRWNILIRKGWRRLSDNTIC
jgi:hypothetical protein